MPYDLVSTPRPQRLPGIPDRSAALTVPFAARFAAVLATRTVQQAKHEHGTRLVFAVCGACEPCQVYGSAVSTIARLNEVETTLLQPAAATTTAAASRTSSPDDASFPRGRQRPDTSRSAIPADVECVEGSYTGAVRTSKQRAARTGAVDGNVPGPWGNHGLYALAAYLVDAFSALAEAPAAIWMPFDPGTCVATDAALRLLGWPTDVIAVVAADTTTQQWPASALAPYLGPRTATNHTTPVSADHAATAEHILTRTGTQTDPLSTAHRAHGLAGLLAANRGSTSTGPDLVLVPQQTVSGVTWAGDL